MPRASSLEIVTDSCVVNQRGLEYLKADTELGRFYTSGLLPYSSSQCALCFSCTRSYNPQQNLTGVVRPGVSCTDGKTGLEGFVADRVASTR